MQWGIYEYVATVKKKSGGMQLFQVDSGVKGSTSRKENFPGDEMHGQI